MHDQNRMAARVAQLKLQAEEAPWRGLTIGGLAVGGVGALFVRQTSMWILLLAALIGAGVGLYLGLKRRARLTQQMERALSNLDRADDRSTRTL